MPIKNKDLGKYNRPGIFINEVNNSIVELPIQNVLINIVPGFSKKGPVNRPVYVINDIEFESIFGTIDKGLERKGSYFHRTCLKMLKSGPIWALNLLVTNDVRDKINWKSISLGSAYKNDIIKTMPYSRLFNRQDFWNRDDEAFLDYVNDPTPDLDRMLHITNFGEKTTTTFIYKSTIKGFDISAEDWYGGVTKVPTYIHPKDWISDYMVSVLILEGDWSKYDELSVDTTWSKYFTNEGLDKTKIQSFVNETNVTSLAFYDASLMPYFKDLNGRDMYIKSVINNDTDKTGLFCAYNEDVLLDSDGPIGKLDLIGDGLVNVESPNIEFLSYNENIVETLSYENRYLDEVNNVFGNYSTVLSESYKSRDSRTASKTNWYLEGINLDETGSTLYQLTDCVKDATVDYRWMLRVDEDSDLTHSPISDYHKNLNVNDIIYFNKNYGNLKANTPYYIEMITDFSRYFAVSETLGGDPIVIFEEEGDKVDPVDLYVHRIYTKMSIQPDAYFNLNGAQYNFATGDTDKKVNIEPLVINTNNLSTGYGYDRYDVLYLTEGNDATVNVLKGVQSNNSEAQLPEFTMDYDGVVVLGYIHNYIEADVTPLTGTTNYAIMSDYTPISMDNSGYLTLNDIVVSGYTENNENYFKLSFGNTSGLTSLSDYTKLRYRAAYDEIESYLDNGKGILTNYATGYKHHIENATFNDYSTTFNASISIPIGNKDYLEFYDNTTNDYSWLLYYLDNEFVIDDTNSTNRLITTLAPIEDLSTSGQTVDNAAGVIGKYSNIYLDYYNGVINNNDYGYIDNLNDIKIYIKAWIENIDKLYIDFTSSISNDSSIEIVDWKVDYTSLIDIFSNKSNYKQTIEIEDFVSSKLPNLVYELKIDKTRYSEIKKGDFIEAYYNEADYLITGDLYGTVPKKLARIITVSIDTINTDLKIIKTDSPINITSHLQTDGITYEYKTYVYPQIDVYVDTYKGIKLEPFKIHKDSIPNGTEERLNSILNVISKTTNLAKGLINKNKISWRYLVDSFGLGLTNNSKHQLSELCGAKMNCIGFINAPSAKELKKSYNPSFVNDDRTLNTEFFKEGGDESKNPSFLYSFAEGDGKSNIGYFFPYVTIDDDGIPKDVPPAAHIASTYMTKHTTSTSSVYPWTISAGITSGRVNNIVGVEMDLTDEDLTNLYQMNLNPIVKKKNSGFCINSESTAQVFPYSSLSFLHSREVLIELENALYDMLLRYQWRFNTPEIRAEIKFRADKICKDFQDRNALYNFKNVIDDTNNTNYIIDLQMGVLDTFVEIVKGMGIIVNNITILKKGDIESGGFK